MSTRSQLRFGRPDRDDATGIAQMYKCSDGYHSAVVHLLVELADLMHSMETLRGPNLWTLHSGAAYALTHQSGES